MEISRQHSGDVSHLIIKGRLDAYWADHLAKELAEVLRGGVHRVRLDLAEVTYLSSAGIGTLLQFYKQFETILGSFAVINPSNQVRKLLELTKLDALLIMDPTQTVASSPITPKVREMESRGTMFEIHDLAPAASLQCFTIGDPSLLNGFRFQESDCRTVSFPASTFGIGLGAFGAGFTDCRARFGEFLSIAGAAAYQPTDGTNVPDYMVSAETFVPELQVLYGAIAVGRFARLVRFESGKETGPVRLSDLVHTSFDIAGTEAVGLVIAAETAGLLGASLRRSPATEAANGDASLFSFPAVRDWLSYSAERAHLRSLALIAGFAVKNDSKKNVDGLRPMLRPLGSAPWPVGHFHAAAFSYRPLKKGVLDVNAITAALFGSEDLKGVLHLISDSREINGAGESEFVRGACWIGPISEIAERN